MSTTKDLWALLWHPNCAHPHIEPLDRTLSVNRQRYTENRPSNGWTPIHVGTQAECEQAADAIRNTLEARAKGDKFYADVAEVFGQ